MSLLSVLDLRKARFKVPTLHDLQHKGEHFFHLTYLGATAVEGHGWHAMAAGALGVVVIIGFFVTHEAH